MVDLICCFVDRVGGPRMLHGRERRNFDAPLADPPGGINIPTSNQTSEHPAARRAISVGHKEVAISNSKGLRWLSGLTIIVALSACSPAAPPAAPPPPKVSVVTLKATPVPITTGLPGRVAALRVADVSPPGNGT